MVTHGEGLDIWWSATSCYVMWCICTNASHSLLVTAEFLVQIMCVLLQG